MTIAQPLVLKLSVRRQHTTDTLDAPLDDWCSTCSSTGKVQSPAWAVWLKRYEHEEERLKAEHGGRYYAELTDETYVALQLRGWMEPTEPEELLCDDCEGRGFVPTEAGSALLGLVTRYHYPAARP